MIDRRLLQAFIVLADEGSVTQAARRLNITQPAMSAQLKRLRDHFRDPLFLRTPKGLVTSKRADVLLLKARDILAMMESLDQETKPFDPQRDPLHLRVEASDFSQFTLLPRLLTSLTQEAPQSSLALLPLNLEGLETRLQQNSLELAIVPDFLAPPNLKGRKLFEEDFVCLMRKGHALADRPLSRESYLTSAHLRVAPTSGQMTTRMDRTLKSEQLSRRVQLTLPSYHLAPEVVAESDLLALFPRRMSQQLSEKICIKELPFAVDAISLTLVWHPRNDNSQAHRWAREFFVKIATGI